MPSRPRYVAISAGLLVSCRVHPMWAMLMTQIAALAMHLIRFLKWWLFSFLAGLSTVLG